MNITINQRIVWIGSRTVVGTVDNLRGTRKILGWWKCSVSCDSGYMCALVKTSWALHLKRMHFIICKLTKLFKRINSNTCKIIAGISFTKESCMGNENIIGRIHLGREEMMSRSKLSEGWGLVSTILILRATLGCWSAIPWQSVCPTHSIHLIWEFVRNE